MGSFIISVENDETNENAPHEDDALRVELAAGAALFNSRYELTSRSQDPVESGQVMVSESSSATS